MLSLALSIFACLALLFGTIALWRLPALTIYVLFTLMILGELGRITLAGQEILLFDLAVLAVGMLGLLRLWWLAKPIELGRLGIPFLLFLLVALLSLLMGYPEISWLQKGVSALYWIRLGSYFLLYLVVRNSPVPLPAFLRATMLTAALLAILGFIQLIILPDFTAFSVLGWDPHQGRLLSTWFDPNFLGGFFAFVLLLILGQLYTPMRAKMDRILPWSVALLLLLAIYFTFSRSAYLMLFVGLLVLGIVRSPRLLLTGGVALVLLVGLNSRAQERVEDLAQSVLALGTNSYDYSLDETSKLRVISWQQAIGIFEQSPWLGVGYNTLRYVKLNEGMILDEDIHSGSGSDSSFLTLLATTGVAGTFFFGWMILTMLQVSFSLKNIRTQEPALYNFGFGLGVGLLALLIHSLTVNSLLLPFILTFVLISFAVLETALKGEGKLFRIGNTKRKNV